MHLHQLTILVFFAAAATEAIPLSQTTPASTKFSPSLVKMAQNEASLKTAAAATKLATQGSPYKFAYKAPTGSSASVLSALPAAMSTQVTKQSPVSDKNSGKNWLLTKAWLIDNINRLRRELSELERDYSQHLNTVDQTSSQKEKQWMEDITKLRADHTVLSQQQKQIIYLIKKNQLLRSKLSLSENDIHYVPVSSKLTQADKVADAPSRRQIKRDLSQNYGDNFEAETRRNMREIFTEVSSLHDISLSLFDGLRSLEHKVDTRDKFSK